MFVIDGPELDVLVVSSCEDAGIVTDPHEFSQISPYFS
jgi:hypothetical protein